MSEHPPGHGPRVGVTIGQAGAVIALIVALVAVWYTREVLLLAFAGVLLAVCLRTIARWMSSHTSLPTSVTLGTVVLLLLGGTVAIFWVRGPAIVRELDALRESIPQAASAAKARLEGTEWGRRIVAELPSFNEVLPDARSALNRATGVISRTFGVLTTIAIVLFLAIAFAATPQPYVAGVLALLPARMEPRARDVMQRIEATLWWWMAGRVLSMLVVAVSTCVGLWLLGIPLAFTLAFIAGLLTFIPNIGPLISALPALLLGLAQGPQMALYVALLYAGVQTVESYLLAPIVDRKTVALPPALTAIAQLVLVTAAGIMGAALAAPLTAVIVVLVTMLYVHDTLGRRDVGTTSDAPTLPA